MSTVFARPDGLRKDRKNKVDFEAMWVMAAKAGYALAFEELVNRNERQNIPARLEHHAESARCRAFAPGHLYQAQEHLHEFRCGSPLHHLADARLHTEGIAELWREISAESVSASLRSQQATLC